MRSAEYRVVTTNYIQPLALLLSCSTYLVKIYDCSLWFSIVKLLVDPDYLSMMHKSLLYSKRTMANAVAKSHESIR